MWDWLFHHPAIAVLVLVILAVLVIGSWIESMWELFIAPFRGDGKAKERREFASRPLPTGKIAPVPKRSAESSASEKEI